VGGRVAQGSFVGFGGCFGKLVVLGQPGLTWWR